MQRYRFDFILPNQCLIFRHIKKGKETGCYGLSNNYTPLSNFFTLWKTRRIINLLISNTLSGLARSLPFTWQKITQK